MAKCKSGRVITSCVFNLPTRQVETNNVANRLRQFRPFFYWNRWNTRLVRMYLTKDVIMVADVLAIRSSNRLIWTLEIHVPRDKDKLRN